ncbi:MAG: TRAP transporter fused permease subunit [Thermoanaerobaculia bacterium]|nr:TRAP transporter fused permease subunit [Thermoanaerobaculia bacterium]
MNYPQLRPTSQLALFALGGAWMIFLRDRPEGESWRRAIDLGLAVGALLAFGYVWFQSEPIFAGFWPNGQSLGDRAGAEGGTDLVVGVLGLLVVLEAARRCLGWSLPLLSLLALAYGVLGPQLPDWLLPHRGYGATRLVSQTFLHSQGVFGVALRVMFVYVFLFVVFGALLEATGATAYVVDASRRMFRRSPGGAAKVAVVSSGLLGSLSGSAVANTATTGAFTIPMMRSSGFSARIAAGVEAAASSGGALVPPVMGAGAYMMLELVQPPVTYLEILRAAILPALLYYAALLLMVDGHARRIGAVGAFGSSDEETTDRPTSFQGVVFAGGLATLVVLLLAGFSVFRAVTVAMVAVVAIAAFNRRTRLGGRRLLAAIAQGAKTGAPLIVAGACVGIVIGVVTLTGAGSRLPGLIVPLAAGHLFPALFLLMICSLVLGMGLPSAVCYLLLATFVGPVLGDLGVVPLAGHLFLFYFGMMSMVTPPVALAAYTASSIAGSPILSTSTAAFRFALIGFALPFLFVYRPELLMLDAAGGGAAFGAVAVTVLWAALGLLPLAAGLSGYLFGSLGLPLRAALVGLAVVSWWPASEPGILWIHWLSWGVFALVATVCWRRGRKDLGTPESPRLEQGAEAGR